jgi:hypothetical protein
MPNKDLCLSVSEEIQEWLATFVNRLRNCDFHTEKNKYKTLDCVYLTLK